MTTMLSRFDPVRVLSLLVLAATSLVGPARAAAAPTVTISPPSGTYATTQTFDLVVVVVAPGLSIAGGQIFVDGQDVISAFLSCIRAGRVLSGGGATVRCAGLSGALFGPGIHSFQVSLTFSDGSSASDIATWTIFADTEP